MQKKIIAVFGGAFNPPTIAHIELAKQILNYMENIKKIIFVPVSTKYNKKGLASDEERFNMLKTVCSKQKNMEVSRVELDSNRQLYTIETLQTIQKYYPENEICFIIGTDNLKELETWHTPNELLRKFRIIVIERDNDKADKIIENNQFLKKYKNSFIILKDIKKINLSSSYIRMCIKENKSINGLVEKKIEQDIIKIYS